MIHDIILSLLSEKESHVIKELLVSFHQPFERQFCFILISLNFRRLKYRRTSFIPLR
jgi:hypothetical protein